MRPIVLMASIALFTLSACASATRQPPDVAKWQAGIYQIESHLRRTDGCEGTLEPIPADEGFSHLYLRDERETGYLEASLYGCLSAAECRKFKVSIQDGTFQFIPAMSVSFFETDGQGGLRGEMHMTGFLKEGVCRSGYVKPMTLEVLPDDRIRYVGRKTLAADYPQHAKYGCSTELAAEAAVGRPCSEIDIITARFVEAL